MTKIITELGARSYPIIIKRGAISNANEYFDLERSAVIVTDDGVPREYASRIASLCKNPLIVTVKQGEGSKSFATLEELLIRMCEHNLGRGDCIVAVGGGVVGDLAGLAAATYMRGIDFYNVPTTLLSQVDSSVGGKTAINLNGIKNVIGAFKQPKAVLIDADTLSTLPKRQLANGLAESIKMAATCDAELFELLESLSKSEIYERIEEIIARSVLIKKSVVEKDEKESSLRMILNFGHTVGHGIEASEDMCGLYHGECVALGMLPMCESGVRRRLISVLEKANLPTSYQGDVNAAIRYISHDKKCYGGVVSAVICDEIGTCKIVKMSIDELARRVNNYDFC